MELLSNAALWLNLSRVLIILFTGLIAWMTYRSHLLIKEVQVDFNLLLSLPESIARLFMVGVCLFLAWLSGLSADQLGFTTEVPWRTVTLGVAVGIIIQLSVNLTTLQAIKHFGRAIYSPWLIQNILPKQPHEWPLIALAFLPPVAMEELLFRTLLIGAFEEIIALPVLIVGTSVVFGLMHQPQGKLGMLVAGIINAVLCLLFVWSGMLLLTLIAHYTINLLQIVAAYYQRSWLENYWQ